VKNATASRRQAIEREKFAEKERSRAEVEQRQRLADEAKAQTDRERNERQFKAAEERLAQAQRDLQVVCQIVFFFICSGM
jgi:hypothetical protein